MTEYKGTAPEIRRVVTGHNAEGQSTVWLDAIATKVRFPNDAAAAVTLWSTDSMPADYLRDEDGAERRLGTAPPPNGPRFSVLEIQPGYHAPDMHRSDSLDCSVVMAGHPTLYLDDGSRVDLNPQDVVVHRGTSHAWANHGDVPAKMFGVLVDGAPKRPGSLSGLQMADSSGGGH